MGTLVRVRGDVDRKHLIEWLHLHVGEALLQQQPFNIQGEGWCLRMEAKWLDHEPLLQISALVEFDSDVHPELVTHFALTWG